MKKLYRKAQKTHRSLNRKTRSFKWYDLGLTKLSVAAFVLFVLSVWPAAIVWVQNTHWLWFLAATIVFSVLPVRKFRNN